MPITERCKTGANMAPVFRPVTRNTPLSDTIPQQDKPIDRTAYHCWVGGYDVGTDPSLHEATTACKNFARRLAVMRQAAVEWHVTTWTQNGSEAVCADGTVEYDHRH